MRRLTKSLLEKSRGAFVLSVELYNKPTIAYRSESFSMLFTNSWELLLKAKIYEEYDGEKLSIFRKKIRNKKRESISLAECLNRIFPAENDKIKNNIQFIADLRNEATHLIIDDFDPFYSRVFQSGVLNYLKKCEEWFLIEASTMLPPGFLALISAEQLPDMELIKKRFSAEDFKTLMDWEAKYSKLQSMGGEAAISVQYRMALVKNPKKSDVILNPGYDGFGVTIVERTKDVDETHPYRAGDVVSAVNKLLSSININSYDLLSYLFVNGLKVSNNEYHWKTKFNVDQYSEALINEIYQSIEQNPSNKEKWRRQFGAHRRLISHR